MRALIFCAMMALSNSAWGDFKPLTRDEPVVRMVLQEAANEPFDGMVAIAGVAYDRVSDRRWPSDLRGVVYDPAQFSGMLLTLRKYSKAQITRARLAVARAAMGARPCGNVLYYHNTSIIPEWNYDVIAIVCWRGKHIFYEDEK